MKQSIFIASDGRLRAGMRALLFLVFGMLCSATHKGPITQGSGPRLTLEFLAIDGVLLMGTLVFMRVLDHRGFRTFGLWFYAGWRGELLLGSAVGGAMAGMVVLTLCATDTVRYHGLAGSGASLAGIVIWCCMLFFASASEEIVFRGYAFQRLVDSISPVAATLVFSALFGASHLSNPNASWLTLLNTVLPGVLLSVAYLKTRAMWMPIGLHSTWNILLGPLFSMPVSGLDSPHIFSVEIQGPAWLSGLAYGPEGSVVVTVVVIAATVWLTMTKSIKVSADMQDVGEMLKSIEGSEKS